METNERSTIMERKYPTLSLNEKERHWKRTRNLMKEKGLDCLLVYGKGRERFDFYLTNEAFEGIVIFPLQGEPAYLLWTANRVLVRLETALKGEPWWVEDVRMGITGPGVVEALQDKGFDQAKIGVVGLESKGAGEPDGLIPYKTWSYVLKNLPKATFIDVSVAYCEMMIVKNEEELKMVRRSADIGEMACEAMMKATKVGALESDIYSAVMSTLYSEGAVSTYEFLILKTGPDNVSWGSPIWVHRGGTPRTLQKGDIVNAEIFPVYGGFETQQQMAVALNPIDPTNQKCADIARRSYEAGLKALRPGVNFRQVCEAMDRPLKEAGAWNLSPLIHTLMPLMSASPMRFDPDQLPEMKKYKGISTIPARTGDFIVQPGMIFEMEPNASIGKNRVNIGGAVLVTKDGVEELNKLPMEMRIL
jgi:Xaa-Pro dipeptidase